MATFAEVVNNQSNNKNNTDESDSKHGEQNKDYASGDSVKPLFLVDQDVFGSTKPDRTHWLTNVEIYKGVGSKVPAKCIKGIQRIRDMWRIYMDNTEDRITLNCGRFKSTWQAGTPSHTKSSESSKIST